MGRLSPTERKQIFELEQSIKDDETAIQRDSIIQRVGALAVVHLHGLVVVHNQPTFLDRQPSKSHVHTYTFEHDNTPVYSLSRRDEWAMGGVDDASWVFDDQMKLPIREIASGFPNFSSQSNWQELDRAVRQMSEALDERYQNPLIYASELTD